MAADPTITHRTRPWAVLALFAAGGWILAGAGFKWLWGSPALLPRFMHELSVGVEVLYPAVIGIELAVVAVAWLRPRPGWVLLVLQYLVFLGVLAVQIQRGEESCGCMGSKVDVAPWQMLVIDGTLLGLLLLSRPWSGIAGRGLPGVAVAVAAIGLLALPWFTGRGQAADPHDLRRRLDAARAAEATAQASRSNDAPAPAAPADSPSEPTAAVGPAPTAPTAPTPAAPAATVGWAVLRPETWVGQDAFSLDLAQWLDPALLPLDGLWVFYRRQCDHCRDHLIELASSEVGQRQVALIRVPEPSDTDENNLVVIRPSGGHVVEVSLPTGVEWVLSTPADAVLEGATVVSARENIQVGH
jgi:hypothetical protein